MKLINAAAEASAVADARRTRVPIPSFTGLAPPFEMLTERGFQREPATMLQEPGVASPRLVEARASTVFRTVPGRLDPSTVRSS